MFRRAFALQILVPSGEGQPGWVAGPVGFFARHIAEHPTAANAGFAGIQLALGFGLLWRPTVKVAIVGTVAWSLGVWWFGEGLGGLAGGHASLITGAPGAVILYGLLAVAAWPTLARHQSHAPGEPLPSWFPLAWAASWLGGAGLQLLPGQVGARSIAASFAGNAEGAPGWLAELDEVAAQTARAGGNGLFVLLVVAMALVGLAGLRPGPIRVVGVLSGSALVTVFWVVGQDLGELYSGQATDPSSGPLLILMGLAMLGSALTTTQQVRASKKRGFSLRISRRPAWSLKEASGYEGNM